MSYAWTLLTAGALKLYDGARLFSDAAQRERAERQLQHPGEPFPGLLPPKPRDDARGHPTLTPDDVKWALGGLRAEPFHFGMAAFLGDMRALGRVELALHRELELQAEANEWVTRREHRLVLSRMAELMLYEVISARSKNDVYPGETPAPPGSVRVLCPKCLGKGGAGPAAYFGRLSRRDRLRRVREAYRQEFPEQTTRQERRQRMDRMLRELNAAIARDDESALEPGEPCDLCEASGTFLMTDVRRAQALGVHASNWHRTWSARYAENLLIPQEWEDRAIRHVRRRLAGIRKVAN